MNIGLGIDTGGTYTDTVLMDMEKQKVLSKAKALTTRDDLAVGISNSIDKLDHALFPEIVLVSMSSTLATNSIVEGKGCRVALISIGRRFDKTINADEVLEIAGGHNLNGKEVAPLDIDSARSFLKEIGHKVDAIAISSYLSVRNPEHENTIKGLAKEIADLPIICGHELTSSLGFDERTLTAVLNARLIPIIKDLMLSVKRALNKFDIKAPLMIVKGDGSIMGEAVALEKPVETILSGPASSLTGAKILTGEKNAIVIDVGGTTTDIGILRDGHPHLDMEGALIGGRRTRVLAADISTSGLGGDSRIIVNGRKLILSPLRVVPLCIAAAKWPEILDKLEEASNQICRFTPESFELDHIIQETEFFVRLKSLQGMVIGDNEKAFMEVISAGPHSLQEVAKITGVHQFNFNVRKLEQLGIIQRIGLTPTDLLHAEGSYREYDHRPSEIAVNIQAKKVGMAKGEFIEMAKKKVINKLCEELMKKLFYEETAQSEIGPIGLDLMNKAIEDKDGRDYRCNIQINKSIIGIGAPVGAFLPLVAERFKTKLILPQHSEVGNAVGAITGSIIEKVDILIKPKQGLGTMEDPACTLFSPYERLEFDSLSKAVQHAISSGSSYVREKALRAGAEQVDIKSQRNDKKVSFGMGYDGEVLMECVVEVSAVGKPRQFHNDLKECHIEVSAVGKPLQYHVD